MACCLFYYHVASQLDPKPLSYVSLFEFPLLRRSIPLFFLGRGKPKQSRFA